MILNFENIPWKERIKEFVSQKIISDNQVVTKCIAIKMQ